MNRPAAAALLGALALASACSDSSASAEYDRDRASAAPVRPTEPVDTGPPAKTEALEVKPTAEGFELPAIGASAEVHVSDRTYRVTVRSLPKGTYWSAAGKSGQIASDLYDVLDLADVSTEIGALPVNDLRDGTVDPKITLELILADGRHASAALPPHDVYGIDEELEKVVNGPVTFGEEPPDDGKHDTIVWSYAMRFSVYGRATALNQVDAVAVVEVLPEVKGTRTCTGYTDNAGNPMPNLELQLLDTEVTVYERRTGDVRARKVFGPDRTCPMFTWREAGDNTDTSSLPRAKIEAWLRRQVKRR